MFTSRAEFRLQLRIDNADERLTPLGKRLGLVSDARWSLYVRKQEQKSQIRSLMNSTRVNTADLGLAPQDRPTISEWIRRPEAKISQVSHSLISDPVRGVLETLETEFKYSGYIAQQERQVARMRDAEGRRLPMDLPYFDVPGLSTEVRQKLTRFNPRHWGRRAAFRVLPQPLSLSWTFTWDSRGNVSGVASLRVSALRELTVRAPARPA